MTTTEQSKVFLDYKHILMYLPAHVFWLDCDHIVLGCNRSQARSLGYDEPQQIIGKRVDQLLPIEDAKKVVANNVRVMSEKRSLVLEEPSDYPGIGKRLFLSSKSPLYDDMGRIIGTVGIAQDITAMKNHEAQLLEKAFKRLTTHRQSVSSARALALEITGDTLLTEHETALDYMVRVRNYYENIIGLMPGHVYWHDREGRILGCNDLQAQAFGFQHHQDVVGRTCHELLPQVEADLLLATNQAVMNQCQVVTKEEDGTKSNGEKKTFFSTKAPLFSETGDVIGILGTSVDVTERKTIVDELIKSQRDAEVANKAKTEFLMNMSHDLRTPFSGILGLSQLLHDNETDQEKKAMLGDIVASGRQLLNLLNEIIDYTRVETGEETGDFRVNTDRVDLPQLIHEVLGLFAAEVQRKKLTTKLDYASDLPVMFITDRVMLHRILLNLLSNAVKFTKHGGVNVEVRKADNTNMIAIAIEDTGIGIAPVDLENIFEKFSRATLAHEGFYQGTGLGLSLVQRMVSCLQGKVFVDSQVRQGTTFTCHLPLSSVVSTKEGEIKPKNDVETKIDSDIEPILQKIARPNPRILVVEDDSISQRVAQYLLEGCGCEVSLTSTAAQALAQDITYYDIILIDIGLPDLSGVVVAEAMRTQLSGFALTLEHPVLMVALTAYVDQTLYVRYRSAGFDHVLRKPLTRIMMPPQNEMI